MQSWGAFRASSIPPSCLHDIFRKVEDYERRTRRDVLRLHVGEPHFAPPPTVRDAFARAALEGRTTYSAAEGLLELREGLAAKLLSKNGICASPEDILVCPGSTQGLLAIMLASANPGEEILIPAIHWPIHLQQALLAGLTPRFYSLRSDLTIDPRAIEEAGSPRTRLLLLNTPANPTGTIISSDVLLETLMLARRHRWTVISDEAYEDFLYEGVHHSAAHLESDVPERDRCVFSVFTFSKSFAMTGYRIGYIVAPRRSAAITLRKVQEASIVSPSTPAQYAALAALSVGHTIAEARSVLAAIRSNVLHRLVGDGLLRRLPSGGWYVLIDIARSGLAAPEFVDALLNETRVAVAPGTGFALRPHIDGHGCVDSVEADDQVKSLVRLAFCGDPWVISEGVRRLVDFIASCPTAPPRVAIEELR